MRTDKRVAIPNAGEWRPIEEGAGAFVPAPLPPRIDYSPSLVSALSEADRALGAVSSICAFVPNPQLLVFPFLRVEATYSSRIEGTVTTVDQLFRAEAGDAASVADDTAEVLNYLRAMRQGLGALADMPVSLRMVRDLHRALLDGVRGSQRGPGEFRRVQVKVGVPGQPLGDAAYVPPPPQEVPALMGNWEIALHDEAWAPPLLQCAILHAQFEMIHPFSDGNGRIGRLLISLFLMARHLLHQPILFLSPYLERHRNSYYDCLAGISHRGDWSAWLHFFLQAVAEQARWAAQLTRELVELRNHVRRDLQERKASSTILGLADALFENPYISHQQVAQRLDVSFGTARTAIQRLEEVGFIKEITGRKKGRVYCAQPLMDLFRRAGQAPNVRGENRTADDNMSK